MAVALAHLHESVRLNGEIAERRGSPADVDDDVSEAGAVHEAWRAPSIATTASGLKIGEHLPKIAQFGDRMAVLRGMSTKEADHGRGTYLMRTGQLPSAAGIQYPSVGGHLSKELGDPKAELWCVRGSTAPSGPARSSRRSGN